MSMCRFPGGVRRRRGVLTPSRRRSAACYKPSMRDRTDLPLWRRLPTPSAEAKLLASILVVMFIVAIAVDNSQRDTVDQL